MATEEQKAPFWSSWGWRLIGVVILGLILWRIGLGEISEVLLQVSVPALAVAGVLAVAALLLRSLRWWLLCRGLQINLSLTEALRIYLVGAFVGTATPGRVGDIVKAYYVRDRRPAGGLTSGIATVVYDRLLDLGQIGALALGAISVLPWVDDPWGPVLVVLALVAFSLATAWGPTRRGLLAAPLGWALQRFPGSDGVAPEALPAAPMIGAQALSLAALACFAGETIVLARGLGIDGPTWWQLAVLAAVGALMGLLPITIFGVGTRDALFVAAAPLLGTRPEAMLTLSLLWLPLYALNGALGWVAWLLSPPRERQPATPHSGMSA
jgi:uncharacterized membrane protein YbhN (UPF0104 family)